MGNTHGKSDIPSPSSKTAKAQGGSKGDRFGLGDRYRLEEQLGRGGTGVTYKAFDYHTKEYVAVKLIARPIPKVVMPMVHHEI